MKVLISGASGFVGRHLVKAISGEHQVYALLRDEKPALAGLAETIIADLEAPLDARLLPDRIDAVVHLAQANVPFPDQAAALFAVNVAAPQAMAEYGRRAEAKKFILASTGSVYQHQDVPYVEDSPVEAIDFYTATKLAADSLLAHYKDFMDVLTLRIFTPYGPGQTGRLIPNLLARVDRGETISLVNGGQPVSTPIYIDDLVRFLVAGLQLEGSHVVNMAGDDEVSIEDIGMQLAALRGRQVRFEHREQAAHWHLRANNQRMKALFGVEGLISFQDGLACFVAAINEEETD